MWRTSIIGDKPHAREKRAGSRLIRQAQRPGKPKAIRPTDLTMVLLSRSIAGDVADLIDSIRGLS